MRRNKVKWWRRVEISILLINFPIFVILILVLWLWCFVLGLSNISYPVWVHWFVKFVSLFLSAKRVITFFLATIVLVLSLGGGGGIFPWTPPFFALFSALLIFFRALFGTAVDFIDTLISIRWLFIFVFIKRFDIVKTFSLNIFLSLSIFNRRLWLRWWFLLECLKRLWTYSLFTLVTILKWLIVLILHLCIWTIFLKSCDVIIDLVFIFIFLIKWVIKSI